MPTFYGQVGQQGVPNVAGSLPTVRSYQSGESPVFEYPYSITGISRDANGAALAGCTVKLFRTVDDSLVNQATSDANGIYTTPASPLFTHYVVSYKSGSPDVAGTTVNTLTGV